jgi:predicted ATPase
MLHEDFDVLAMPSSIRELVAQRVDRLGERAHAVLSLGAVIGREFDLDTLAIVAEIAEDPLIDLLDQATAAALVIEHEHEPGRYRFSHALIQHTLYQDLSATRRQRAHRRIAEALELDGRDRIAELAHHWYAATRPADAAKALAYTQRAADAALTALAAEDAIRWYERALDCKRPRRARMIACGAGSSSDWPRRSNSRAGPNAVRQRSRPVGSRSASATSICSSTRCSPGAVNPVSTS